MFVTVNVVLLNLQGPDVSFGGATLSTVDIVDSQTNAVTIVASVLFAVQMLILDRLGRSLRHLITIVEEMRSKGIALKSLQDNIDSSTAAGELQFHIFGALAQFERALIQERTKAGLASARARGRFGGRPKKLTSEQMQMAAAMMQTKTASVTQICATFQIGRTTLYKYVTPNGEIRKG